MTYVIEMGTPSEVIGDAIREIGDLTELLAAADERIEIQDDTAI